MPTEPIAALTRRTARLTAAIRLLELANPPAGQGLPDAKLRSTATVTRLKEQLAILEGFFPGEFAIFETRTLSHAEAAVRLDRWLN